MKIRMKTENKMPIQSIIKHYNSSSKLSCYSDDFKLYMNGLLKLHDN